MKEALRFLASVVARGVATTAPPARADEPDDRADCFERRQYDACFREGKRLFADDAFDEAHRAYLEGWRLQRNYEVAGNLGNVALKLGRYAEAYTYLRYSLDNLPPSQRKSEVRDRLREKIDEALAHVGARKLVIAPADAKVTLDGEAVAADPDLWIAIEPGEHPLRVEREGYEASEKLLDVRAGDEQVVEITLARAPGAPAAVEPHDDEEISAARLGVGVTGIVLGAGGVVAAVVLGFTATDRAQTVDELGEAALAIDPSGNACGAGSPALQGNLCSQLESFHREEIQFRNAAIVSGAVGLALVTAGVIALTFDGGGGADSTEGAGDTEVGLRAGPASFGLELRRRF